MTPPKEVTWNEMLAELDESVHEAIKDAAAINQASAIVVIENLDMWSSRHGDKSALCVGPTCTYKRVEDVKRIGDVPSRFQYPKVWAKVPNEVLSQKARRIKDNA